MSGPRLVLQGISKRFGGVQALEDVNLIGEAGQVHGLIGPNGAGKSTLIGCITGVNPIDCGEIRLDGRRIEGLPLYRRSRLGVARTFQKIRLAQDLSVFDNVAVGLAAPRFAAPGGWLRSLASLAAPAITEPVEAALALTGLQNIAHLPVASLPYGRRHFVELARALVAQPSVILLDEPATGLTDAERQRLGDLVRQIAAQGALVILVEHDLALVGRLCDCVTVIEYGRHIFHGTPAAAQRDPAVIKAYLGTGQFVTEAVDGQAA